jgi:hypothetical protein
MAFIIKKKLRYEIQEQKNFRYGIPAHLAHWERVTIITTVIMMVSTGRVNFRQSTCSYIRHVLAVSCYVLLYITPAYVKSLHETVLDKLTVLSAT